MVDVNLKVPAFPFLARKSPMSTVPIVSARRTKRILQEPDDSPLRRRQFREIRLRNFCCFRAQQAVRLAPLGRIHTTRDRKDFRPAHRKLPA